MIRYLFSVAYVAMLVLLIAPGSMIVRERAAAREAVIRLRLGRKAKALRTGVSEGTHWRDIRREEQSLPEREGGWFGWLILAGRGWGKTRTGAETAREWALRYPGARIGFVGGTFGDIRDTMFEGASGILSIVNDSELRGGSRERAYNRTLAELIFANGSQIKGYSSERPGQLRGPELNFAWGDEPAKWQDAPRGTRQDTTYTNMRFALRGRALPGWDAEYEPRFVFTGTPAPVALLKSRNPETPGMLQDDDIVVTRGSTSSNLENLSDAYYRRVIQPLVGTRLAAQELEAQLLEDTPGALWKWADISDHRVAELDLLTLPMSRVVVAVDPSGGDGEDNDEVGITANGISYPHAHVDERTGQMILGNPEGYLIADRSGRYSPAEWARVAVELYAEVKADMIVAEVNYGGAMVVHTIHSVAPAVYVKELTASRGKAVRAQPISSRYEQGTMHHVGVFLELEEELTTWVPGMRSPNRLDALVWGFTELFGDGTDAPFVY